MCVFTAVPFRTADSPDVQAYSSSACHARVAPYALFRRKNLRLPVRTLRQNILPKVQSVPAPAREARQSFSLMGQPFLVCSLKLIIFRPEFVWIRDASVFVFHSARICVLLLLFFICALLAYFIKLTWYATFFSINSYLMHEI